MRIFYEHVTTKEILVSLAEIGRKLKISTTWAHLQMREKKLPYRKITEKEVLRRATAFSKQQNT